MTKDLFIKDAMFLFCNCILEPCLCGTTVKKQRNPAIVGGNEAEIHGIPWQVGIGLANWDNFIFCGGTIIGKSTIVTAAHCVVEDNGMVSNIEDIVVVVAEHDTSRLDETNRT